MSRPVLYPAAAPGPPKRALEAYNAAGLELLQQFSGSDLQKTDGDR
jgi:hypothetical protein